jgi:hypothetical protein
MLSPAYLSKKLGELQGDLAGVEDYILAEAVWREAIARWPGAKKG